jgi:hypothetical protein
MKTLALGLAFLLAMPLMLDEASAAERGGGGSSRDSGDRGSFSRGASPSRSSGGSERQSHSAQRDASPSRGFSFSERRAQAAPANTSSSRDTSRQDRAVPSPRSRVDADTRRTAEAPMPGGMSSGTAFPRSDARERAVTERREVPQRPGGMGAGPSFSTQAPTTRQSASPQREAERRSPRMNVDRSDDLRSGGPQPNMRVDRRGNEFVGDEPHRAGRTDLDSGHRAGNQRSRDVHTRQHSGRRLHAGPRPDWRGDIRHFKRHDFHTWRGGSWHHGHHHGRFGWWWIVGPSWYFYSGPVYPYPNPYVPPVVVVSQTVIDHTDYWYYCEDADDYYPYVEECAGEWIPIPAEPENAMPPRY